MTARTNVFSRIRQSSILRKAQELLGTRGWFTLLHGDEIFHDDPNVIAERADGEGLDIVRWRTMNFFWHVHGNIIRTWLRSMSARVVPLLKT